VPGQRHQHRELVVDTGVLFQPGRRRSGHCSSKAALRAVARDSQDVAPKNIRVNTFAPGAVDPPCMPTTIRSFRVRKIHPAGQNPGSGGRRRGRDLSGVGCQCLHHRPDPPCQRRFANGGLVAWRS
jgi:NAD(P)-dependent dehydrogenase (short-subunit alcohol dehydrogenase family)